MLVIICMSLETLFIFVLTEVVKVICASLCRNAFSQSIKYKWVTSRRRCVNMWYANNASIIARHFLNPNWHIVGDIWLSERVLTDGSLTYRTIFLALFGVWFLQDSYKSRCEPFLLHYDNSLELLKKSFSVYVFPFISFTIYIH